MINWYEGAMDTNLVIPRGVDQTEVIFDFYFSDVRTSARRETGEHRGQRAIQDEDVAICESVQRGLGRVPIHGPTLGPPRSRRASLPSAAARRPHPRSVTR